MLTTEIQALGQWKQEGSQEFKADLSYSVPDQAGLQSQNIEPKHWGLGGENQEEKQGCMAS